MYMGIYKQMIYISYILFLKFFLIFIIHTLLLVYISLLSIYTFYLNMHTYIYISLLNAIRNVFCYRFCLVQNHVEVSLNINVLITICCFEFVDFCHHKCILSANLILGFFMYSLFFEFIYFYHHKAICFRIPFLCYMKKVFFSHFNSAKLFLHAHSGIVPEIVYSICKFDI